MIHTIGNGILTVAAEELGAQLQSIRSADGTQYLWQGDAKYWKGRAPNIFPYVARLWQGRYEIDGNAYEMPIHGFAPTSRFELREKTDRRMTFERRSDEKTYVQYPRQFIFRVSYSLSGNRLETVYEVVNLDEKPMYFGLGGHPGFNVPLEPRKAFEDYRLRFGGKCKPVRVGFSSDCFVNGQDEAFVLEDDRILKLRHELFDDDAIVLRDMAREVTLEAEDGARSVTVSFPDMPYLGIWHRPKSDAPYVCIEPWVSLPAKRGETTVFERQEDLVCLRPGKRYANAWSICINHLEM